MRIRLLDKLSLHWINRDGKLILRWVTNCQLYKRRPMSWDMSYHLNEYYLWCGLARSKGLEDRITFVEDDVMEVSLSDATLVLCYLSPGASAALKPKLKSELKLGTRVVMETFAVPG